jgi:ferredoxin-NADP reductase
MADTAPITAPPRVPSALDPLFPPGVLVVVEKHEVADGVVRLALERPGGGELPPAEPGAHVELVLPSGTMRQYSLCGPSDERDRWAIAVLRERHGRGGSAEIHDAVEPGHTLGVVAVRNNFRLGTSAGYLLIAGGIGITPILSMARELEGRGADWRLVYGGRSRASMAFVDELEALAPGRVRIVPEDELGKLDLDEILRPVAGWEVYCCGPEGLLEAVEARCADWPPGALHVERFSARELAPACGEDAFEVVLVQSGIAVHVPPGRSILEVAREHGADLLSSCEEGTCGTCMTRVIEGEPEHRDSLLTEEERRSGDQMMICVSRSRSPRLVLDA